MRTVLILSLLVCLAVVVAAWRISSDREAVTVVRPVNYELTAYCLVDRQSWRNFMSTLNDLERDLRFCIEVWPSSQKRAP